MDEGIPLGKVVGFPLSIDWSVLVIMWLFTWSLAATLPDTAPGHSSSAYWLAGACGAAVLLASLLAHELTHAIVARHRGVEVLGVKLWLFGGIARLGGEAKTPGTEFRIAVSGPAMSLTQPRLSSQVQAAAACRRTGRLPPCVPSTNSFSECATDVARAPGSNAKRTTAGSPPLCGNAQATSIPTVVSDLR